ncbi:hypothetical protein Q8F55_007279 [Vanrija albida]|uniref:DOPA 4,5-dioxygenase n=1 Tax=Vanrija albida TaxID=181172 RepID=A0ABR3PZE7_9TREE
MTVDAAPPRTILNGGEEVPNPNPAIYALKPYIKDYGTPRVSYETAALPPLPGDVSPHPTGRGSHTNPPRQGGGLSPSYGPLYAGRAGRGKANWDIHIYYKPNNLGEKEYARALHSAIRREFPELKVYRFWDVPIGPHPLPMFEVDVFSTEQLGALLSYLVENKGPLSVLIHPNTGDAPGDHSVRATWLGPRIELDVESLYAGERRRLAEGESEFAK